MQWNYLNCEIFLHILIICVASSGYVASLNHGLSAHVFPWIFRCNTSLLIDYSQSDGKHSFILIDVGKTFREQVLRWFPFHKIPQVDSVSQPAFLLHLIFVTNMLFF